MFRFRKQTERKTLQNIVCDIPLCICVWETSQYFRSLASTAAQPHLHSQSAIYGE